MENTIRINPRDFIMGPYLTCPRCSAPDFGVLYVDDTRCERRCRACWFTTTVQLPRLKKKIIYIDQSAISNIMKTLSPDVKGHERAAAMPFWKELFETLSVACHLQLVVCPESREHEYESLTSPFFGELKCTYEYFSGGASFHDPASVMQLQIARIASSWLRKERVSFEFDAQDITHGNVHQWRPRIRASAGGQLPGTVQHLRKVRDQAYGHLKLIFKQWQQERKTFEEVLEIEKRGYRLTLLTQCKADYARWAQAVPRMAKGEMPALEDLLPSDATYTVTALHDLFQTSIGKDKCSAALTEFFCSDAIDEAPFNIIQSSMYASLAAKAAAGQKEVPNQGTFRDVNVVSTLLPYCDAMFLDNKCRALLHDIPREHKLPFSCALFSLNTGAEFIRYLQQIIDSVSAQHLKVLEDVYGPHPLKPHSGIYGIGKFRRAAGG